MISAAAIGAVAVIAVEFIRGWNDRRLRREGRRRTRAEDNPAGRSGPWP